MSCRGYQCARARRAARRQQLQAEYRLNAALKENAMKNRRFYL